MIYNRSELGSGCGRYSVLQTELYRLYVQCCLGQPGNLWDRYMVATGLTHYNKASTMRILIDFLEEMLGLDS